MSDLEKFLRRRLAEDEAAAFEAASGPVVSDLVTWLDRILDSKEHFATVARLPAKHRESMLAEVEGQRQIIRLHHPGRVWTGSAYEDGKCTTCLLWESQGYSNYEDSPCPTLRALASMYADRDGYREEWRP